MAQGLFSRNRNREGAQPRGTRPEWWSAQFGALLAIHVFKDAKATSWTIRLVGLASSDYEGYDTRENAMRAAFGLAKGRLADVLYALGAASVELEGGGSNEP